MHSSIQGVPLNELKNALDDLDGLREAFHAVSDPQRKSPLVSDAKLGRQLRHELAAGADAYAATLISSSRGELDGKRIKKCRREALARMPAAIANQKRLAALVNERREPSPEFRSDVQQLLCLSLHCRAALAALAPTVDRRAADALGNKVLVELRGATLLYLSTERDAFNGTSTKPRSAVLEQLKKTESHASEFVGLAPGSGDGGDSLGVTLSKDVVDVLHRTSLDWTEASVPA
jgi:hypothetical protein